MKKIIIILTVLISCHTKHVDTIQKDTSTLNKHILKVAYLYDYVVPSKICDCDCDWKKEYDAAVKAYEKAIEQAGWPKKSIKHTVSITYDPMSTGIENTAIGYAAFDTSNIIYGDLATGECIQLGKESTLPVMNVLDTSNYYGSNDAFGYYPVNKVTTGSYQVAIGRASLRYDTTVTHVRLMKESDSEITPMTTISR